MLWPLFGLALFCLSGCSEDEVKAPSVEAFAPQTARVNEQLSVDVVVSNPAGVALTYAFSSATIPDIEQYAIISGDARGGVFQYTPLVNHVGTHEFTISIKSSAGDHSQPLLVTVNSSESAAPSFLHPIPGSGGVYDLSRDPCVRFDIEIRDDDSSSVTIRGVGDLPVGASIDSTGAKSAAFAWCPAEEQIARTRNWSVSLEADDGEHDPVPLGYTITLRSEASEDCPGKPPTIRVESPDEGASLSGAAGYPVVIEIEDDLGFSEAPLLLFSAEVPDDAANPDLSEFGTITFAPSGPEGFWEATIPPLDLAEGQELTLYYLVSVTDDDDKRGTLCDHLTETPLRQLTVTSGGALATLCDPCASSDGCDTGLCVQGADGSQCLPTCGDGACSVGSCMPLQSLEGAEVMGCGNAAEVCALGCIDDEFEDNNQPERATDLGSLSANICAGDRDFFFKQVDAPQRLTLQATPASGLSLQVDVYNTDGELICYTAPGGGTLELCPQALEDLSIEVYGDSATAEGSYTLALTEEDPASCCANDINEPNNLFASATETSGVFEGTLCPCDVDFFRVPVTEVGLVNVSVIFNAGTVAEVALYDPSGIWIKSDHVSGDDDTAEIIYDTLGTGDFIVGVFALANNSGEFIGEVTQTPLVVGECVSTSDCPLTQVCSDGSECLDDVCADGICPADHACTVLESSMSVCLGSCADDSNCREGEACKSFPDARRCALTGVGLDGAPCPSFEECAGDRICYSGWSGGYCAVAGCASNADCPDAGSVCTAIEGEMLCLQRCSAGVLCREAEGYICAEVFDVEGNFQDACIF